MNLRSLLFGIALALTAGSPLLTPVQAAVPTGFTENTIIASHPNTFSRVKVAPDGRVFVLELGGAIHLVINDVVNSAPLGTIPNVALIDQRGLHDIAFDPDFGNNGYIYVNYAFQDPMDPRTRISRFTTTGNTLDVASEVVLFEVPNEADAGFHSSGGMAFGPDGKLYVGVGDHNIPAEALSLSNLKGKVLRLDPDGMIPADNPLVSSTTGINQAIYARGLRHPHALAFDPVSQRLFINEVGASAVEEVNIAVGGENFGWNQSEGPVGNPAFTSPFYHYDHSNGACSITGGTFYDSTTQRFPTAWLDKLYIGTYCLGEIRAIDPDTGAATVFASDFLYVASLDVSPNGDLYALTSFIGNEQELIKISYTGNDFAPMTVGWSQHPVHGWLNYAIGDARVHYSSTREEFITLYEDGNSISTLSNPDWRYDQHFGWFYQGTGTQWKYAEPLGGWLWLFTDSAFAWLSEIDTIIWGNGQFGDWVYSFDYGWLHPAGDGEYFYSLTESAWLQVSNGALIQP